MNQKQIKYRDQTFNVTWENFTPSELDGFLAAGRITTAKRGVMESRNGQAVESVKLFDRRVKIADWPSGRNVPAHLKHLIVLEVMFSSEVSVLNPEAALSVGEEVQVAFLDGSESKRVLKFAAPNDSQQAAYEGALSRQVTNASGETMTTGVFLENLRLAKECFRGAEGFGDGKIESVAPIDLERGFVALMGELRKGFDLGN